MIVTKDDILEHRKDGTWRDLEKKAQELIADTRLHGGESFEAVLGGGTRLMLALGHRISDDIDLFVNSAGWLPYVSPRLNDRFENEIDGYEEDSSYVKLNFPTGQIDFIASSSLLSTEDCLWNPATEETSLPLMPPAEILAKKLFFRGWALHARDLFDWIVLQQQAPANTISDTAFSVLLAEKMDKISKALIHLSSREDQQHAWKNIKSPYRIDLMESVKWAEKQVKYWMEMALDERRLPKPKAT